MAIKGLECLLELKATNYYSVGSFFINKSLNLGRRRCYAASSYYSYSNWLFWWIYLWKNQQRNRVFKKERYRIIIALGLEQRPYLDYYTRAHGWTDL